MKKLFFLISVFALLFGANAQTKSLGEIYLPSGMESSCNLGSITAYAPVNAKFSFKAEPIRMEAFTDKVELYVKIYSTVINKGQYKIGSNSGEWEGNFSYGIGLNFETYYNTSLLQGSKASLNSCSFNGTCSSDGYVTLVLSKNIVANLGIANKIAPLSNDLMLKVWNNISFSRVEITSFRFGSTGTDGACYEKHIAEYKSQKQQKEAKYKQLIKDADYFVSQKQYDEAIDKYEQAQSIYDTYDSGLADKLSKAKKLKTETEDEKTRNSSNSSSSNSKSNSSSSSSSSSSNKENSSSGTLSPAASLQLAQMYERDGDNYSAAGNTQMARQKYMQAQQTYYTQSVANKLNSLNATNNISQGLETIVNAFQGSSEDWYARQDRKFKEEQAKRQAQKQAEEKARLEREEREAKRQQAIIQERFNNTIESVLYTTEGMTVVRANSGLYGFQNEEGKLVVKPIYSDVRTFSQGYAAVNIGGEPNVYIDGFFKTKGGKWSFVDKTGKEICTPAYDDVGNFDSFSDFAPILYKGKWGFIDKFGEHLTPCIYESVGYFYCGKAKVKLDSEEFYIDENGKKITDKPSIANIQAISFYKWNRLGYDYLTLVLAHLPYADAPANEDITIVRTNYSRNNTTNFIIEHQAKVRNEEKKGILKVYIEPKNNFVVNIKGPEWNNNNYHPDTYVLTMNAQTGQLISTQQIDEFEKAKKKNKQQWTDVKEIVPKNAKEAKDYALKLYKKTDPNYEVIEKFIDDYFNKQ